jgi:hypothetical protein
LVRGLQSLVAGQAADAAQQGRKILAVDVLHGEGVKSTRVVAKPTSLCHQLPIR